MWSRSATLLFVFILGFSFCVDATSCRTTQWNYNDSDCSQNETEIYTERFGTGVSRRLCCAKSNNSALMDRVKTLAAGCRMTKCIQAFGTRTDLCSYEFPERFVGSYAIKYREEIREVCSSGVAALCCPSTHGPVTNGYSAEQNEFPYVAYIRSGIKSCTGAIYSDRFIITTAGCIRNGSTLTVTVGSNVSPIFIPPDDQVYIVENVIVHPEYSTRNGCAYNDIALLKLNRNIKFGGSVKTVKLPTKEFPIVPGRRVIVAGWWTGKDSVYLRKTTMTFSGACVSGNATGQFICVDNTTKRGSSGSVVLSRWDAGSPVTCRDEQGEPVLCGIRSGSKCSMNSSSPLLKPTHFSKFISTNAGKQRDEHMFKHKMFGETVLSGYSHQVQVNSKYSGVCGGTVVSSNSVVTGAHCVYKDFKRGEFKKTLNVSLGSNKTYSVIRITLFPGFNDAGKRLGDGVLHEKNIAVVVVNGSFNHIATFRGIKVFEALESQITGDAIDVVRGSSGKLVAEQVRLLPPWECSFRFGKTLPRDVICGVERYSGGCDGSLSSGLGGGIFCNSVLCGVQVYRGCRIPNLYLNFVVYSEWVGRVLKTRE